MSITDAIIQASLDEGVQTKDEFLAFKRKMANAAGVRMPPTSSLRRAYDARVADDPSLRSPVLERILTRREVRSLSGVAIVTVLTKPYACPGKCVYCPTEAIMPKSYLSNEPAAMRALMNRFDPWRQVASRLRALTENGHAADKIELIVKGGTWSAYPWDYRQWFIKRCFDACNAFRVRGKGAQGKGERTSTLAAAQKANESAAHRVIGVTLETRPDWITPAEIVRLRELGCTRVELGVQSVDDRILAVTKRGHDVASVVEAARLLKDAGYKTDFHMMPQLPGATPASDLAELRRIFADARFRPDMIKIYPCVTVELAELHQWWKDGKYVPYSDAKLVTMLMKAKASVPRYCRISRLIRDIPSTSIVAGNAVTNLRQVVQEKMKARGLACACLRCREIGRAAQADPSLAEEAPAYFDDAYEASGGEEHFLSFEDAARRAVFAFCRLRLPPKEPRGAARELWDAMPEIRGAAFVRELHTYGVLVPIAGRDPEASQHKGLGRALMTEAERIARAAGYRTLAVISGIGVRAYYRKLG
ncbi:MAG TPA: tRNA uridine(34) 5-carboxymethylaminomethyl modification radical SAM/GNAT enzyme Elp3, partial [Patescibacteria group bacterium]|nr:tRNA uridine(34) 5-carboxymethylaminomethyl modification radical SAM/GNAT enzyme Elp3 [Patescibacteria group bacterium]